MVSLENIVVFFSYDTKRFIKGLLVMSRIQTFLIITSYTNVKSIVREILMHMMHGNGSVWTMLFMVALWIGLIIFGIYLTIYFIRAGNQKNTDSLKILQERLAKGEIDENEYYRLREIILQDNHE